MQIPWEAIIALGMYVITSTVGFVWWMATQSVTLQFLREDLAKANKMLMGIELTYATKVEVSKDNARIENSLAAAHKRIDMWTK